MENPKHPNVILFGIDSLRSDHMSLHGYHRLTTPHIDKFAMSGTAFMHHFSPSIPTTPGFASMLTGMDCFGTDVVALRHQGSIQADATLAEILREHGYRTTCVGFTGNPSSRGFDNYLDYEAWKPDETWHCPKAGNVNDVTIPELRRLAQGEEPFFLFIRHMDPHSPYLPPAPFERLFYGGNEKDPDNHSLDPVFNFKPFADFFKSWIPQGCTDRHYVDAQYDGAIAYMDASIGNILAELDTLGLAQDTLVVVTSDHGETLYEHGCFYDHHGLYECTLTVPLVFRLPGRVPESRRVSSYTLIQDVTPTILELLDIETGLPFNGRSLVPLMAGEPRVPEPEFYITECTWMRKHGWRTPEWKLIRALEPDFHGLPEVELYNLVTDPLELNNVADLEPDVVLLLTRRMEAHIAKREREVGRPNPMVTNLNWHGYGTGPFESSEQAYNTLHINSIAVARSLQAKEVPSDSNDG